ADFMPFKDVPFPINIIYFLFITVVMIMEAVKNMMMIAGADLRRKLASTYEPADAGSGEILPAAFMSPEKTAKIRQIIKNQGLSDEQIDILFIAMTRPYGEDVCRDLYLRGVISKDQMYIRMRESGFT
ncbi:unnamed protein product, partial [marine sediment metagenome]